MFSCYHNGSIDGSPVNGVFAKFIVDDFYVI